MYKSKLSKVIVALLRRIAGVTRSGANRLMRALLRSLMAMGRRANLPVAGFVLPTVTMVLLVVILLTIAITLRSFDRANTARNVRVNQQVLAAATPAIDRAKAKIQFLLEQTQNRGTPSDRDLYLPLANPTTSGSTVRDSYTFGDEERLKLKYDLDKSNSIGPDLKVTDSGFDIEKNESINTAWRYPVDTNNDGKFDNYTMYGIFFRTPLRIGKEEPNSVGEFKRKRQPLEARMPPVVKLKAGCEQGGGTVASLAGDSGWYRIDGKLKKSFFVYTVNVPMTADDVAANTTGKIYQPFNGTPSISALEYQQDQAIIPIGNNAVVYEDDLDISPGPLFNLNGRIFTNSNLLVTNLNGADRTRLYQVSSPDSCFYEQENSKIVVAGNVVNGWFGNDGSANAVGIHLFKKDGGSLPAGGRTAFMLGKKSEIKDAAESTSASSLKVGYNNEAYTKRLKLLVDAQMGPPVAPDNVPNPEPQPSDPFLVRNKPVGQTREQALEEYFKQMLRKVPFAEVPLGGDATAGYGLSWSIPAGTPPILDSKDNLRPIEKWTLLDLKTPIELNPNQLEAKDPLEEPKPEEEEFLGDRVVVGNNLPAKIWKDGALINGLEKIEAKWNSGSKGNERERSSRVTKLADVGATKRNGFWESSAAEIPKNPLDGVGGLRVITSAGVYERTNSFLPPPTWIDPFSGATKGGVFPAETYDDPTTGTATTVVEKYPVVWPDTMPMSPVPLVQRVYNNGGIDSVVSTPTPNSWDTDALPDVTNLPLAEDPSPTNKTIDPRTPKYAKGDLRMRATAVYHYKKGGGYDPAVQPKDLKNVKPFACVSSYYDPSTASTARNLSTLPAGTDVSGETALGTQGTQIGSNNGVVYGKPADRTQDPESTKSPDPTTLGLLGGNSPTDLERQANYVFPDGRFANEPLRKALLKAPDKRELDDRAAIDSTMCALEIIATAPKPLSSDIPHGAIQEVAFLNAREVKAIDRDDPTTIVNEAFTLSSPLGADKDGKNLPAAQLTGNYNQPMEERQPLEIRATQIDLNLLRNKPLGIDDEYLLPNSGIIYATRDDALPDRSSRPGLPTGGIDDSKSAKVSPTDSRLDPTRKPNAILLINGEKLARVPGSSATVADVVREKGLTLASNLPVYIKGEFNLHTQREFKADFDWATFYDRPKGDLNKNFACRPNDPRLNGQCTTGDTWRPANILADAVTLLSKKYRFGFRNEGDFDLRNNAGAAAVLPRRQQGFYNNNFVTNGLSSGAFSNDGNLLGTPGASTTALTDASYVTTSPAITSSYFNNFVTPVQRRGAFPEYLMEVCTKLPVSACTDSDWYVDPLASTPLRAVVGTYTSPVTDPNTRFKAGSTVDPPVRALQRFPRRVAFQRNASSNELLNIASPQLLGISGGSIAPATTTPALTSGRNSLWFATNSGGNVAYDATNLPYRVNTSTPTPGATDGSKVPLPTIDVASTPLASLPAVTVPPATYSYNGSQPLLMPVPQFMGATAATPGVQRGLAAADTTGWMQIAENTTFNLIVGANDTPSRTLNDTSGDFNGGLQNLPRFLEVWSQGAATPIPVNIQGSFIQLDRSEFNTAPFRPTLLKGYTDTLPGKLTTLFAQSTAPNTPATALAGTDKEIDVYNISGGQVPYFTPPTRNWGYDLGLLSQPADLFTRKFTTPPSKRTPDEYFREVPRNDEWVETLLCAFLDKDGTTKAVNSSLRPTKFCTDNAGG